MGAASPANELCTGGNGLHPEGASDCIFILMYFVIIWYLTININQEVYVKWYHYIACFFAGAFLANMVPHYIHGVSGDCFPSPFANPPGKGLSSPTVNVVWGLANLVAGYVLFKAGRVFNGNKAGLLLFFAGIVAMSIMLSFAFVDKFR